MNKRFLTAAAALLLSTTMVTAQEQAAQPPAEGAAPASPPGAEAAPSTKPSTNPDNGKQYGDWRKECEIFVEPDGSESDVCQIEQSLVDEKSQRTVLKMALGFVPGQEEAVLVVTLPIGIILPPGVAMRVDAQKEGLRVPVFQCIPSACIARTNLKNDVIARLKNGNQLELGFIGPNAKKVTAKISLTGITAGLNSFKK